LPVVVHDEPANEEDEASSQVTSSAASIHIELSGHAFVSVVGSADPAVIRALSKSMR